MPTVVKLLNFPGQCNLFQIEFHNDFGISVILTYDILNKISKLGLFGHFYFQPLLAPMSDLRFFFAEVHITMNTGALLRSH